MPLSDKLDCFTITLNNDNSSKTISLIPVWRLCSKMFIMVPIFDQDWLISWDQLTFNLQMFLDGFYKTFL